MDTETSKLAKKIVFFDGDGTLWYPKKTKRTVAPHWIYDNEDLTIPVSKYLPLLTLTPNAKEALRKLKSRGVYIVVVSTHPHHKDVAEKILAEKVSYFGLGELIDEAHSSLDVPDGKGMVIEEVLKRKGLPKAQALLVGDSYRYDYLSAQSVNVDALLIRADYSKERIKEEKISRSIDTLSEVLNFI